MPWQKFLRPGSQSGRPNNKIIYQDILTTLVHETNDLSMPCHEKRAGAAIVRAEPRSIISISCVLRYRPIQGRRPMGGWGTVPPKNLRWKTAHVLIPPIFREVVLSDARESMNRVKNGLIKEFFSEIVVFLVKKGSYTTFYHSKERKI